MVARPGTYLTNFTSGELSPELHGQFGLKWFHAGAAEMTNVEPVPQGGFRLMPRSRRLGRRRRPIVNIATTNETDSSGSFSAPGTVFEIEFAGSTAVSTVTVTGFVSPDLDDPLEGALKVQWFDGTWHDLGAAIRLTSTSRNIMRALAPANSVSATKVRVQLVVTPGSPINITVASITARRENIAAAYDDVKMLPFTFSDGQTYQLIFGGFHTDVYRDGVFIAGIATGLASADVGEITATQRFDTMLVAHENITTLRIFRDGSDDEWVWGVAPYEKVPQTDYGGDYTNGVSARWGMNFTNTPEDGVSLMTFTVNGQDSEAKLYDANPNNFGPLIKEAIEDLSIVAPGIIVTDSGAVDFTVEFAGDDNLGDDWFLEGRVVNQVDKPILSWKIRSGALPGEDVISTARGWPAAIAFYQDRLWLGGFKARGSAFLASATADYFNLDTTLTADTGAILNALDTEGAERIHHLFHGDRLLIFTSNGEYFISDRLIARNTPLNVVQSSQNGSPPGLPILSHGGEVLYISKNRSIAYAMSYSDIAQRYQSLPISLLSSHLVENVADAALQRPETETDATRYWLLRDDGEAAVGFLINVEEVRGFVRWRTAGEVKAVMVDGANAAYMVVERTVAGGPVQFLERLEEGLWLDCAQDLFPGSNVVTGLGEHEGEEVWLVADGYVVGPYTVENARVTLPFTASAVTVGRWTPAVFKALPIPRLVNDRVILARPIRVHTVRANVIATSSIAVGANGEAPEDVGLYSAGAATDQPVEPYTGEIEVPGLEGFSEDGAVVVTQLRPGSLEVRDITREAKL